MATEKSLRAFMKRPITLISTAAMAGVAMLGVVVLGDLSGTETTTATVASKTYQPADKGELTPE